MDSSTPPLLTSARTHRGLVHHSNEDAYRVLDLEESASVLLLCDGMGGMGRGDLASSLAVQDLAEVLAGLSAIGPTVLRHALIHADQRVRQELCTEAEGLAGCTAVVVHIHQGYAHVGWAGDSRAYLLRDGQVVERTRDHKLVEDLIDSGEMSAWEARRSDLGRVVTRALGGRPLHAPPCEPAVLSRPWMLQTGDQLVLCSDGLSDLVEDQELARIVGSHRPSAATEILMDMALARGGHDNITVLIAHWTGRPASEEDYPTQPLDLPTRAGEVVQGTPMPAPPRARAANGALALAVFAVGMAALFLAVLSMWVAAS